MRETKKASAGATGHRGLAAVLAVAATQRAAIVAILGTVLGAVPVAAQTLPGGHVEGPVARTLGALERVRVEGPPSLVIPAELAPEASGTVLYADDIQYLNTGAGLVVSINLSSGEPAPGPRWTLKADVDKDRVVHERNGARHEPQITLQLCLGATALKSSVRVLQRHGYGPPLRLGREDLAGLGRVDPHHKFTVEPSCTTPRPAESPSP